ncbi:MAG: hypothetical protein AAF352_08735, partial [Pseudomonadota bacterium]
DNVQAAQQLLQAGASPIITGRHGRNAHDLARLSQSPVMMEMIVTNDMDKTYGAFMLGHSWASSRDTMAGMLGECVDLSLEFSACALTARNWLNMDNVDITAQFDRFDNNRLVALQIDSSDVQDTAALEALLQHVTQMIAQSLPLDQPGFVLSDPQSALNTMLAGQGDVLTHYWSDQNRRKPVYVRKKLLVNLDSDNAEQGFVRVVIGNPFRTS